MWGVRRLRVQGPGSGLPPDVLRALRRQDRTHAVFPPTPQARSRTNAPRPSPPGRASRARCVTAAWRRAALPADMASGGAWKPPTARRRSRSCPGSWPSGPARYRSERWTSHDAERSRGTVAFLIAAPLAWAALLLFHPLGSGEVYDLLRDQVTRWQVVHVGTLLFIGLMGLAVFTLVRGLPGRLLASLASGPGLRRLLRSLGGRRRPRGRSPRPAPNSLPAAERAGGADAIQALYESPIVGDFGLLSSLGSLGWVTAVLAAGVALRTRAPRGLRWVCSACPPWRFSIRPPWDDRARLLCCGGAADPPRYEVRA